METSLDYTRSELARQAASIAQQFRAATIQAFEYTYELSHKTLKRYLEMTDPSPDTIDEMTFQDLIRPGAERGLLQSSWDVWKDYRKARGTTRHTYSEISAADVFAVIPAFFVRGLFFKGYAPPAAGSIARSDSAL